MTRAYLRLDPAFFERKVIEQGYPAGAALALIGAFCLAESQPERGRFRSERVLKALLDSFGRWVPYLLEHGDIEPTEDGRVYVIGWDEWQEGDVLVAERVKRIRARRGEETKSAGARRTANWRLRKAVFERDGHTCRYCGKPDYPRDWLVLEHVDPAGPASMENLVTACRSCNKLKGGRTPEQAGMLLRDAAETRHGDALRDPSQSGTRDASPHPSPRRGPLSDGGRPAPLSPPLGNLKERGGGGGMAGRGGRARGGGLDRISPEDVSFDRLSLDELPSTPTTTPSGTSR